MGKNKVLFVVNSVRNGGAERVCENMAKACVGMGYEVDFVSVAKNNKTIVYEKGIRYYSLGYDLSKKTGKIRSVLFGALKLNRIISKSKKEYVLITSHLPLANIITRFSHVGDRAIYVVHCTFGLLKSHGTFRLRCLLRLLYRKRKIVCVSYGIKNELEEIYGLKKKYLKVIYNPIEVKKIRSMATEDNNINRPYILLVGRLKQQKRFDRALEIYKSGRFYKRYDLVFCGTGELEKDLKRKALDMNIDKSIFFLGWQDNVYKWMKNAALLLCTSDFEGFPMNMIEAAACGTPIVSADCEYGPSEILIGDFARYLVKKDDIKSYIDKMNLALKSYPVNKNPILKLCDDKYCMNEYLKFAEEKI
ncbi:glycosyltransferase [Candidatus Saccharibacteria bacterium]|nr:glycosyltransferase [Candidatus Saccharibacteria bacterium]